MIKKHSTELTTNKAIFSKFKVGERFFYRFKKGERVSHPLYKKIEKEFYNLKRYCTWITEQSEVFSGNIVIVFGEDSANDLYDKVSMNGDILYYDENEYFFIDDNYQFKTCKRIVDLVEYWRNSENLINAPDMEGLVNVLEFYDLMLSNTSAPKTLRKYLLKNVPEFT